MIIEVLSVIYRIVLTASFVYSLFHWKRYGFKKQNGISIYLGIVFFTECLVLVLKQQKNHTLVYTLSIPLFFIAIAIFYAYEWKLAIHMITHLIIIGLLLALMLVKIDITQINSFNIALGVILGIFYIICSLHWFYYQIKYPDEILITKKLPFWISIAIMFWSIIFIFRVVLMYYLDSVDRNFLTELQIALTLTNIIVYILFIKGIACQR